MNSGLKQYTLKEIVDSTEIPMDLCNYNEMSILENFKCVICNNLVLKPVACTSCTGIYCQTCHSKSQDVNLLSKTCPLCKNYLFQTRSLTKIEANILNNIVVLCMNGSQCNRVFKYSDYLTHMSKCPYTKRVAICKQCKTEVLTTNERKEIKDHVKSCPKRLIACEDCLEGVSNDEFEEHKKVCSFRYVDCDNCKKQLRVNELEYHLKKDCLRLTMDKLREKEQYGLNKYNLQNN
jgi:hypothetical protein